MTASGNELFYYTWPKDATHNYEIDFLVSRGSKICPIEVKSSGYKSHASLDAFSEKFILESYLAKVPVLWKGFAEGWQHSFATILYDSFRLNSKESVKS